MLSPMMELFLLAVISLSLAVLLDGVIGLP